MGKSAKKENHTEAPPPNGLDFLQNRRCTCPKYEPNQEKNPQDWD
jgi:hypothetical protein